MVGPLMGTELPPGDEAGAGSCGRRRAADDLGARGASHHLEPDGVAGRGREASATGVWWR